MSFLFNSIDFTHFGVSVLDEFKPSTSTGGALTAVALPASDKVWFERGAASAVPIEFPVAIEARSPDALIAKIDSINAALVTESDATLQFWYTDRYWLARWDRTPIKLEFLNKSNMLATIRFLAQPNMLANSASTGSVAITANPQTVYIPGPLIGDGVVAGNTTVAPTLILRNTGTTIAAGALSIWNYTTGDFITYADSVPATTYVKFDCENRIAYTSPDGTTYTAQAGKVLTNWLTLAGGAAGRLIVDGVATTATLSWSYRGRFL